MGNTGDERCQNAEVGSVGETMASFYFPTFLGIQIEGGNIMTLQGRESHKRSEVHRKKRRSS